MLKPSGIIFVPLLVAAFACWGNIQTGLQAAEWPQFRGPKGNGVSESQTVSIQWSEEQRISWKQSIDGIGWSQPIVWGETILLTSAVADEQTQPR